MSTLTELPADPHDRALADFMARDLSGPRPAGLASLANAVQQRLGNSLQALVLYGSTRRSDNPRDGLVDLLAVVSSYRDAHGAKPGALFNRLLPPNVYYLETGRDKVRLRCKYIVISWADFQRRMRGGIDGYFWSRFTQPCRLLSCSDREHAAGIAQARANAAMRFATNASGLIDQPVPTLQFWQNAIRASYGCELRPEPPGAAQALVERDPEFWRGLSDLLLPRLPGVRVESGQVHCAPSRGIRLRARLGWKLRRLWSRTLNVLRLFKAAGTFANGVDYLSWKLERHSGIRIEPTERMRRYPRLAAWGMLLRLIRSGALR